MGKNEQKKSNAGQVSDQIEEDISSLPNMEVSHLYFLLKVAKTNPTAAEVSLELHQSTKDKLLRLIQENSTLY